MPRPRTGQVRTDADGNHSARITITKGNRPIVDLPTCKTSEEATERALVLSELARRLVRGGHGAVAESLVQRAARAGKGDEFDAVLTLVGRLERGVYKMGAAPTASTFGQLAEQWTSGELSRMYPDHVKKKRSADSDEHRLKHVLPLLKDTPLVRLSLDDADRVMQALPDSLSPASRRHVAQVIRKLLAFAVFPCRIITANPLPPGWLPKLGPPRAKSCVYPDEDSRLMRAPADSVSLAFRIFYGFLHREGPRKEEALSLRWTDLDLERGGIVLDKNKTDDPRAWALDPGVVEALKAWRTISGAEDEPHRFVFSGLDDGRSKGDRHDAERYRDHLKAAGVDRPELFKNDATRRQVRLHDARATFITIALANGRSETWVADRTGHRSSDQIAKYRRAARTVAELGLGELEPLHLAIPELAKLLGSEGPGPDRKGTEKARSDERSWRNWQTRWIQVPVG